VFVVADGGEPVEWHRWNGDDLAPVLSQQDAENRAAEVQGMHPDWAVAARQTDAPPPGSWRETFREYLP
jgi:hypothetical protein